MANGTSPPSSRVGMPCACGTQLVTRRPREYWTSRWSALRPRLEQRGVLIVRYPFRPRNYSAARVDELPPTVRVSKPPCCAFGQLGLVVRRPLFGVGCAP